MNITFLPFPLLVMAKYFWKSSHAWLKINQFMIISIKLDPGWSTINPKIQARSCHVSYVKGCTILFFFRGGWKLGLGEWRPFSYSSESLRWVIFFSRTHGWSFFLQNYHFPIGFRVRGGSTPQVGEGVFFLSWLWVKGFFPFKNFYASLPPPPPDIKWYAPNILVVFAGEGGTQVWFW